MKKSGFRNGLFAFLVVLIFVSMAGFVSADVFVDNTDTNFSKGTLHLTNITGSGAEANVTLNFTTINTFRVYNKSGNFTSRIFDTGQIVATFDKIAWARALTNSSDVIGTVYDRGVDDMAAFLRNGSYVADITHTQFANNVDFTEDLQKYNIPSDFSYDDIIGFAIEEVVDDVAVFFRNGSFILDLDVTNLSQQIDFVDSVRRFTLPAGFNASDAVGVEYHEDANDVAIFFRNGSYISNPSHTALDGDISFTNVNAYTIPPSLSYEDIMGFGSTRTADDIGAFFRNGSFVTNTSQPNFDSDISFEDFHAAVYPQFVNLATYTNITLQTRVSNDSITFTPWSRNYTNSDGSEGIEGNKGRYIQYKAVLETPDKYITPFLENVSINYSLDLTKPSIRDPSTTANSRNFVSPSFIFNASANATDTNLLNVTCTLSGTTVGFFSVSGDIHVCNLTAPAAEGDFVINITAIDKANNTNSTTINFTTKHSTSATLNPKDATVSNLNQSDKTIEINVTLNNTGNNPIYDAGVILNSFSSSLFSSVSNTYQNCSQNINSSQSCTATFSIKIAGGTTGTHSIFWNRNWTNSNFTQIKFAQVVSSTVTISNNPQMTTAPNVSAVIRHAQNSTMSLHINSTGNSDLESVTVTFVPGTIQSSWLNATSFSLGTISAAANATLDVNVAVPKYTNPGNYTGTFSIAATSVSTKTVLLIVEVPADNSWTSFPNRTITHRRSDIAGIVGQFTINNTGNVGHNFTFYPPTGNLFEFPVWNDSNIRNVYVERGEAAVVSIYHKQMGGVNSPESEGSFNLTFTIRSENTSQSNTTFMSLVRDDNNPFANITNPVNNSFVKGSVNFKVNSTDLNLSSIEFYIGNELVLKDANITRAFSWNTTNGSYPDEVYTLKAIAYDSAGNFNTSDINVTVNNTNDNPIFTANIPTISVIEDNDSTILNLSLFFKTTDGDTLKYNFTRPDNVTVHITNTTHIANFTPANNFAGINNITFTAIDSSLNTTSSNLILINVANVNDAPTTPALTSPQSGSNVTSSAGKAALMWSASADVDNDTITYYVFVSNDSSNIRLNATTAATTLQLTNLGNNIMYYWKALASDSLLNSSNSSIFNFTVIRDNNPVINKWTWNNTINISSTNTSPIVAENRTLNFTINASDPDNNPINFTWFRDNVEISNVQNFTFNLTNNFTAAGAYALKLIVADNNSNSVSQEWQVTVTNTNREPTLDAITNKEVLEDSTLIFNITALDLDGDSLSFTSNISSITFTNAANSSLATVNWTPTNDNVGNNTIQFTVKDSSKNDSKTMVITVNNTNDAPIITSFSPAENKTIAADIGSQKFNVTFVDADRGDSVSIDWILNGTTNLSVGIVVSENDPQPVNASIGILIGNLTKGLYNVTAIVTDGKLKARYEWKLTVTTGIISDVLTSPITSLNQSQRENVTGVAINHSTFGGIDFGNKTMNFSRVANLEDAVNLSSGMVSVDTDTFPELKNKSAFVVVKGLNFTKVPLIYRAEGFETTQNGAICHNETCTEISYNAASGILRFRAANFSTYFTQTNTTNGAPIITSIPVKTATENAKYTYDAEATDPDGDVLTFSLTTKPSGMSIGSSTGVISWTPTTSQLGLNNVIVNVSDGNLTAEQSFNITVGKGPKLTISDLDIKVDTKTDKGIQNNTKISKEASPGSKVEFKLEAENLFTNDEDLEIEDIDVEITIEDIDDGEDLEEDADEFDLKSGKNEDVSIEFDIPLEVDEGIYDVIISVEGEDENQTKHEISWNLKLEVEKETHEIRILKSDITPSTISCQRQVALNAEIINTGTEDEDEVTLEITGPELGISSVTSGIELDEGTEDNRFTKRVTESISKDILEGVYPVTFNAYYDSSLSETKTVDLTVGECELTKAVKEKVKEKRPEVEVIRPKVSVEKPEAKAAKPSFRQTDEYRTLLAIMVIVFIGTAVFVVGGAYMLLKK